MCRLCNYKLCGVDMLNIDMGMLFLATVLGIVSLSVEDQLLVMHYWVWLDIFLCLFV